ncbi:MAG: glycoside hydrolase [Saprospiraceae bacterium]|nr:glycoside hydrolase [Saprospiraceae bacterium]
MILVCFGENFCITERIKWNAYSREFKNYYFWRTYDQQEIDFLEDFEGKLSGFEFKFSSDKFKQPAIFLDTYPDSSITLINRESYFEFILCDDLQITYLPFLDTKSTVLWQLALIMLKRLFSRHFCAMNSSLLKFFMLFLFISLLQCSGRQQGQVTTIWPEITSTAKPWTRWWWMGNAVNKKDIEGQLRALSEAGFGGVEITPIYGVKGSEDQYLQFLSDEWMDMLQFTILKAGELGLGVDMNLGTGWPYGGPQVTPQFAASKLMHEKYDLKKGQNSREKIISKDPDQNQADVVLLALTAYFPDGKTMDLMPYVNDENQLDWIPEQDCEVFVAFNGKTRQKVKRSAPGGEGWSLDHFSRDALDVYLARFDSAFSLIPNRPRAFFNDSYEVYGSSATEAIFSEFEKRRGYDLKPYLRDLFSQVDSEIARRIQSDYRQTFFELLMDEFTIPWKDWSNAQKVKTRNQAHGSPGNLIDLYGIVDIPECETFGSSYFPIPGLRRDSSDIRPVDPDPVMLKLATSAANVLGKSYVSSETFTWLAEHFKVSLSQCKPELEQVFLAGVNHVFYHGTTYSPEDAAWPGWLFYASVQFGPVNSFWSHINGLNGYIARCQSILQQGKADSDLLVYWPYYDAWDQVGRLDQQISVHNIDEWLHPTPFYKNVIELMSAGYLMDFATDNFIASLAVDQGRLTASPEGSSYKTLIIPACDLMPLSTLKQLILLAENGATVIFEKLPKDVPGFHELDQRRKEFHDLIASAKFETSNENKKESKAGKGTIIVTNDVAGALNASNIRGEKLVESGLKFVRRIF